MTTLGAVGVVSSYVVTHAGPEARSGEDICFGKLFTAIMVAVSVVSSFIMKNAAGPREGV